MCFAFRGISKTVRRSKNIFGKKGKTTKSSTRGFSVTCVCVVEETCTVWPKKENSPKKKKGGSYKRRAVVEISPWSATTSVTTITNEGWKNKSETLFSLFFGPEWTGFKQTVKLRDEKEKNRVPDVLPRAVHGFYFNLLLTDTFLPMYCCSSSTRESNGR